MTEQEIAEARKLREAYTAGHAQGQKCAECRCTGANAKAHAEEAAKARYPIRTTRQRTAEISGTLYRVTDGELEFQCEDGSWWPSGFEAERLRQLADLLANPTEEIEE